MKKVIRIPILVFGIFTIVLSPAFAQDCPFSVSVAGQFTSFMSGDAGDQDGAPKYKDAFDIGTGIAVEGNYRLNDKISIIGGIGYEHFSGDEFQGISFKNLEIIPIYLGAKYYLTPKNAGWNPYLRGDIGMAKFGSVDISYLGTNSEYWDGSWELLFDAGAGVEYLFNSMAIFAEIKARYLDEPSSSPAMAEFSDSDSSWSLPITVGITFYF